MHNSTCKTVITNGRFLIVSKKEDRETKDFQEVTPEMDSEIQRLQPLLEICLNHKNSSKELSSFCSHRIGILDAVVALSKCPSHDKEIKG